LIFFKKTLAFWENRCNNKKRKDQVENICQLLKSEKYTIIKGERND